MGDAVHQLLVQLAAEVLVVHLVLHFTGVVIDGGVGGLPDQLLGSVDTVGHGHPQHRLAVKPGQIHLFVGGNDDAVALSDLLAGQHILGAAGTLGLHLDGNADLSALLLQGLSGHVGVGDAGGAGGDGQNPGTGLDGSGSLLGLLLRLLLGGAVLGGLELVNDGHEGVGVLGLAQLGHKLRVHQQHHQVGQNLQVQVTVHGSGDHEEQVGGLSVHGAVVHALLQNAGRQAGLEHAVALGVGHRNARLDGGAGLSLPGQDGLLVGLLVGDAATARLESHQQVNGAVLVLSGGAQGDLLTAEQINDTRKTNLLFSMY